MLRSYLNQQSLAYQEPTVRGILIEKHGAANNEGDSNYQLQATMMEYSQRKRGCYSASEVKKACRSGDVYH